VSVRRLHRLAPVGFRAPLSEPGVHLSLCTGLSIDVDAKSGVFHDPVLRISARAERRAPRVRALVMAAWPRAPAAGLRVGIEFDHGGGS
jgi:hypothetical protein